MKIKADLVIMDWGVGGLSVYREVRKALPGLSILYYSDSGAKPYGKMTSRELDQRLLNLMDYFKSLEISRVVIACNAASTALPRLQKALKKREMIVSGVIDCGLDLINRSNFKNVGVIGGRRTIASRCFTKPYAQNSKRKVTGRVAQPLSAMIEAGELHSSKMTKTLKKILLPLEKSDALLLACTHYPAIAEEIQKILPNAKLLDPAAATALELKKNWKAKAQTPHSPLQIFMTSGNPRKMISSAKKAFQVRITKVLTSAF